MPSSDRPALEEAALAFALPLLLILSPLPYAGRTPAAAAFIAAGAALCGLIGLAALLRPARTPASLSATPVPAAAPLAGFLLYAALQACPLPAGLVAALNPAAAGLRALALPHEAAAAALSLAPSATLSAIGRLAAALAIFAAAALLARRPGGTRRIAAALCAAGTLQAVYGLIDFLTGHHRIFGYVREAYIGRLAGTYINPNHFAGLMELALPAALGLLLTVEAASGRGQPPRRRGLRGRIAQALSDPRRGRQRLLALAIGAMALALLCSRSRAGIALAGAGCLAVLMLCPRVLRAPGAGEHRPAPRARLGALALPVLIALAALSPIAWDQARRVAGTYRTAPTDLLAPGGRAEVWADTLRMLADHPRTGVGFAAFAATFPRYRDSRVMLSWEEAHNDWLQILAETGLPGAVLLLAALAAALVAGARSWRPRGDDTGRNSPSSLERGEAALRLSLACGCLALLAHETLDFNLQIPANAIAFAAAAAAALVRPVPGLPRPVEDRSSRTPGRIAASVLLVLSVAGAAHGALRPGDDSASSLREARRTLAQLDATLAEGPRSGKAPPGERRGSSPPPASPAQLAGRAHVLLERALRGNPASADAHLLLARLRRLAPLTGGLPGTAVRDPAGHHLTLAARLDPHRPDLRLALLRERVARREADAALRELTALADRGGEPFRLALPLVWSLVPDPARVAAAIPGADPDSPGEGTPETPAGDAPVSFAHFLVEAGHGGRAERILRGLLDAPPALRAIAYGRLAYILSGRDEAAEIVRLGEELLRRGGLDEPQMATVLGALGRGLARSGRTEEAAERAAEAIAALPASPSVRQNAADIYLAADRPAEAARQLEFLLRGGAPPDYLDRNALPLRETLARAYDRMQEREAALREWREVERLDPRHAEARDRIRSLTLGF